MMTKMTTRKMKFHADVSLLTSYVSSSLNPNLSLNLPLTMKTMMMMNVSFASFFLNSYAWI